MAPGRKEPGGAVSGFHQQSGGRLSPARTLPSLYPSTPNPAPPNPQPPPPASPPPPSPPPPDTASRSGLRPPCSYQSPALGDLPLSLLVLVLHVVCGAGRERVERKDLFRRQRTELHGRTAARGTLGAHRRLVPGCTSPSITAAIFVST